MGVNTLAELADHGLGCFEFLDVEAHGFWGVVRHLVNETINGRSRVVEISAITLELSDINGQSICEGVDVADRHLDLTQDRSFASFTGASLKKGIPFYF